MFIPKGGYASCVEGMKQFMWIYINPKSGYTGQWQAASLKAANNLKKGPALAKTCAIGQVHSFPIARISQSINMEHGTNL